MTPPFKFTATLIVAALVATLSASTASAQTQSACTFTVSDPVPIGPELATFVATFSRSIGDTLTASFPEDAKVEVVSVKHAKTAAPLTATVSLTTIHATAGQWLVSVRGEKGVCTGKVWVGQGFPAAKVKK